ncbi:MULTISPECIES: glutathione S-transferase N-terminal domain-containing protein [unclassified Brevundimonas]|uniref:glutathione S-transferase N-terminal domain-containing protein n=1 Tax=unclassified Brevundimonas TaxID=2622653 RepID=UPI000CFD12FB|nr:MULTISPECIES: glutathione S-transferase N-terminal domain-containing protein [unclassified Brevundimonas]PRA33608.1 glutathione S-transferase [Brevundimonas sp. MYb27]PQZ81823.1 glutathione S-transferase [Brevundimonas sp. MYb31]PRB13324.1 glutathione S-transferase [Brevundimonas sp. MYb52]PRB33974.1 glutathione S-transferase [Brevundimonas sp. MYb46]PRB52661.1 glutathione S-transferase [Brevundimonas sp. MYb33]
MTQPIELWYWPTPNGWKISIALEEMGLPYVVKSVNIGAGEQFAAAFQAISPNGRMPAIVDPDGPDGRPLSIFESGAILQYLGEKSGRFYPSDVRARVEVDQWLFWQVGGLGPMAGQTHHFRQYAPAMIRDQRQIAYGVQRYTNETHRLYGVLNRRLADRDYVAGKYSIADMAIWPWILPTHQGQDLSEFPHLAAWMERVGARPAVKAGRAVGEEWRANLAASGKAAEAARGVLFGQRAR